MGSQVWVLGGDQQILLFAKETGSYTREFFFHVDEDDARSGRLPLIHIEPTSGGIRGLSGADFVIRDWQDRELFKVTRALSSLNRTWKIEDSDGDPWGRAFEGGGTSVARRVPFVKAFTVLSMNVELDNGAQVASFARKRMSLGDVYNLSISNPSVDRRLLISLGVLFETIHD